MSEEMIIRHCSPTLAGLKTGNIFTCSFESEDDMKNRLRKLNGIIVKKGLRALALRYSQGRAMIYIYRPARLHSDLRNARADSILRGLGYTGETEMGCVLQLMKRLGENGEFPHEIGLFLGYPPEDVQGFIDNKADNCKCVGCWKVYGDEEKARITFGRYRKCTDIYCAKYAQGKTIEKLTVGEIIHRKDK